MCLLPSVFLSPFSLSSSLALTLAQLFAARHALLDGWRRALGTALADWGTLLQGDGARAALLQVAGAALRKLVSPHARLPLLPPLTETVAAVLGHLIRGGAGGTCLC
jgi:hypothetical protein